jgi:hypothetical protein
MSAEDANKAAQFVKLVTSEGETVSVDAETASKSVLIKGMIDDSGVDEEVIYISLF